MSELEDAKEREIKMPDWIKERLPRDIKDLKELEKKYTEKFREICLVEGAVSYFKSKAQEYAVDEKVIARVSRELEAEYHKIRTILHAISANIRSLENRLENPQKRCEEEIVK